MIVMIDNMVFRYDGREYDIVVVKKNNKNTYVRVKDGFVYVTTNYYTNNRDIEKLIRDNYYSICKMIDRYNKQIKNSDIFYLFGKRYDIIFRDGDFCIDGDNIYVKNDKVFSLWLDKYIGTTFFNHLKYWYDRYEENIPVPNLKIRKMKTRWGVCNVKNHNVTLNYDLYKYDIECLDYVIVHELSHFIYANHSKLFWSQVFKYFPNYKEVRKKLRG